LSGGIFLKRGDVMVEMFEQPYAAEDDFQKLLADYPNLLAGDQIDRLAPRRWLLIAREVAVASEPGGSNRWSLDHLFLDQDAIPTIIEVKRSADTRIRREVVGQMLDYAANAVVYWDLDVLRKDFESACVGRGGDPAVSVSAVAGAETDLDEFWNRAKTNLQAGRVRLIFVADEIPTELQRIVEFLNERMTRTEVLAIELRRYTNGDDETLVPRVFGQTAAAVETKRPQKGKWNEARVMQQLTDPTEAMVGREIFEWARRRGLRFSFGQGAHYGSFMPVFDRKDGEHFWPIALWTNGVIEVQFGNMTAKPPFDRDEKREELWGKLNALEGVDFPNTPYPRFPLAPLVDERVRTAFFRILDWAISEVEACG
jgi:hypothetical protein